MANDAIKSGQCPAGFVYIPAGTFPMGSEEGQPDAQPVREVTISKPFCVSKTEVTESQYVSATPAEPIVLEEPIPESTYFLVVRPCGGNYKVLRTSSSRSGLFLSPFQKINLETDVNVCGLEVNERKPEPEKMYKQLPQEWASSNKPMSYASYDDARNYCKSIGGRLLTEAEWEYVARGEDHQYGVEINKGDINLYSAVYNTIWFDSFSYKSEFDMPDVCSKAGHYVTWGGQEICDMNGSAAEWVADTYASDAYETLSDRDPVNTAGDRMKVLRGGSWLDHNPSLLDSARRDSSYGSAGFRCAVPPQDIKK